MITIFYYRISQKISNFCSANKLSTVGKINGSEGFRSILMHFASFGEGQLTCRTLHRLQSQQKPLPSSFSILLVKESLTGT